MELPLQQEFAGQVPHQDGELADAQADVGKPGTSDSTATLALLIVDAGVPSLGHRNHLLSIDSFNADNREIGVGHAYSAASTYNNYWAIHATRTSPNDQFLTGVVFNDLNGNGRYDLNEGLEGVTINAAGKTALTNAAGGWSIKATAGTYTVTASGGAFLGQGSAIATVGGNVEVDFISGQRQAVVDFVAQGSTPPSIASADHSTFTVGTQGSFTVAATGNPAPTFSETGALPAGVTLDSTTGALAGTPAAGTGKTYPITIKASNGVAPDATQRFTLTVNPEVLPLPTANPDTFVLSNSSSSGGSGTSGVLANDVSADGQLQKLAAVLVSTTTHGTLTLHADGSFSYTPDASFAGLDRFTYQVSEGAATGNTATVNLISQQASVVDKLYNQVLGRVAEDGGLQYWTGLITHGASYSVVAEGIFESDERLNAIIGGGHLGSITYPGYYPQFLLRAVEPAGLSYWKSVWKHDGGPDHVISGMISSPEFLASAGRARPDLSPNAAWVTALYERLLNREPEAGGLQFWTGHLDDHTMTEQQVVLGFVQSGENFRNLTTAFFQQYMQRKPTDSELAQYVGQFKAGGSQRNVQEAIVNLPEYANTPPAPVAGTVGKPLYTL